MEIVYLLIPVALVLVGLIIAAFMWAIRAGQFDDLEGPAHRILMDDDEHLVPRDAAEPPARAERSAETTRP
jgi:cbb3-type cytochrome oxidase maturation protein